MTTSNPNANNYGVKVGHSVPVSLDVAFESTNGLLVDVTGLFNVTYSSGSTDIVTLASGMWHPMAVTKVSSASTTGSGVHAGY